MREGRQLLHRAMVFRLLVGDKSAFEEPGTAEVHGGGPCKGAGWEEDEDGDE